MHNHKVKKKLPTKSIPNEGASEYVGDNLDRMGIIWAVLYMFVGHNVYRASLVALILLANTFQQTLLADSLHEAMAEAGGRIGGTFSAIDTDAVLAVGPIYVNGDSTNDLAKAGRNALLLGLAAQRQTRSFEIIDRANIYQYLEERKMPGAVPEGGAQRSDAPVLVVGDLLIMGSDVFWGLVGIDSQTSEVIFADMGSMELDDSPPGSVQPTTAQSTTVSQLLAYIFSNDASIQEFIDTLRATTQKVSLSSQAQIYGVRPIEERILFHLLIKGLKESGFQVYDRLFLGAVAEEARATHATWKNLESGDHLVTVDFNGSGKSLNSTLKATSIASQNLAAVANIKFNLGGDSIAEHGKTGSFSAAIANFEAQRAITNLDELKFVAKYTAGRESVPDHISNKLRTAPNDLFNNESSWRTIWGFQEGIILNTWTDFGRSFDYRRVKRFSPALPNQSFDDILYAILSVTQDERRVQDNMIKPVIFGIRTEEGIYIGLLNEILTEIVPNLTFDPEAKHENGVWQNGFYNNFSYNFINHLFERGSDISYSFIVENCDYSTHLIPNWSYSVEIYFEFNGIYPEWVRLQIDLSPMKNKLIKVKP